ncbi:low molecular weight protein-tyrosine-phosphatase [Pedomonas mirosovicensis]|uniref:low molecular weight protein-tyrosine-phosphatase n=1 Tax=Pedomonas mirosovicensis TaxID=2908641 RepID=UPI002169763F|nr:low molecular weight protein-tyrosine-phosphatase [Pedomonas mirosovicensis]MCH8684880.1 low molecular weight phosphotyrosine protein phosphatase [Pedomonas mirosovicensis]
MEKTSVLFVCLGNICRSPVAEGVFRHLVEEAGLGEAVRIDSAGTGDWHVGCSPDPRSCAVAAKYGIDIAGLRARQISREDFSRFRFIIALDDSNLENIRAMAPMGHQARIQMLLDFVPGMEGQPVPDPYYGGEDDFEEAFRLARVGCEALLEAVRADLDKMTAGKNA